jgi:hypothetical protein
MKYIRLKKHQDQHTRPGCCPSWKSFRMHRKPKLTKSHCQYCRSEQQSKPSPLDFVVLPRNLKHNQLRS